MILDFSGDKIKGQGHYPGGQSGNPGSDYYMNFVEDWLNQEYHEFIMEEEEYFLQSSEVKKSRLVP